MKESNKNRAKRLESNSETIVDAIVINSDDKLKTNFMDISLLNNTYDCEWDWKFLIKGAIIIFVLAWFFI